MRRIRITSEGELRDVLRRNAAYANGKNGRVDHLYATAAVSRFEEENVFGVYLTVPAFAWMAVWIAATDRAKLRKRQLAYHAPRGDDTIGSISIGGLEPAVSSRSLLCNRAFVYLFDAASLPPEDRSGPSDQAPVERLMGRGYAWKDLLRRNETRRALTPPPGETPAIVPIDAWQSVVVGVDRIVPSVEIELTTDLIDALAPRVRFQPTLPGRDYLAP